MEVRGQELKRALLVVAATLIVAGVGLAADDPDDLQIWKSFREALGSGEMADPERYRPLQPSLRQPMMGYLEEIRKTARWDEGGRGPEVFHVENRVHYITPLTFQRGDSTATETFCFSLVLEEGKWYFQHLESIFIRLDKIGKLPVSSFPDLSDERKAWIRDEIQVSRDVRLFGDMHREKGKEAALNWFKDGGGYALQAQVWVPFVAPDRAFILYLCWDLSNLRGEPVVLEKLSDQEARVRFTPRAFALYDQAAHLKQQINFDDYRRLFEVVWLDRARSAGWDLRISYEKDECVFRFVKLASKSQPGAKEPHDR